jgi:hypothetical protein
LGDIVIEDLDKKPKLDAMMGNLSYYILESNPRFIDGFVFSFTEMEDVVPKC